MPNPVKLMMGAAGAGGENTFMWGTGAQGYAPVIGDGTVLARSSPVLSASGLNWTAVGMSQIAAAGVSGGKLYTWGAGSNGALGDGTTVTKSSPTQVGSLTDWATPLDGGTNADSFSGCIKTDGTLWMWGLGTKGQLGDGTVVTKSSPVQIGSLTNWSKLYSGDSTSFALKTDGTLWVFGEAGDRSSGTGISGDLASSSPVQIGVATNWAQFSSGSRNCAAIDTAGKLWTWGTGAEGILGHGNTDNQATPLQVGSLTNWANVAMNSNYACLAIKTDGTLWGWGNHEQGLQGHGDAVKRSSPVQVGSLTNWSKVAAGTTHMSALKTDGTIWAWGNGGEGRLGDGQSAIDFSSPIQIGSGTDWTDVFGSKAENTLWLGPKA
jgi:alpha-tubulin suppressor-like RCC1 family protein